jgi:hypothetical protein
MEIRVNISSVQYNPYFPYKVVRKKLETLSFRDRFDILLKKKLSGVAVLKHKMLYGKCQFVVFCSRFFGV